ncbi:hypothetical protein LTR78_007852 [Recurvomyces mirabilis]|uniref:Ubiquitin-like protein smt3 n=1 Tax=Recurvomyces mirabilis TaxID=574656 RepID=A0AAE0TSI7_9PEZI|nr:hypothetical protein LTR78_007852 [Recurvomyces mirabilis]KAK5160106.1 hypothetical protein LTS14_002213 [Recurvomyces mirabilis]
MAPTSAKTISTSLKKLDISSKSKQEEPADSWDAEEDSDTDEDDSGNATPVRPTSSSDYPGAPPPTPSSPSFSSGKTALGAPYQTFPPYGFQAYGDAESAAPARGARTADEDERRPEKSTAVASRLIAAGIGQKAPRRTKEQREYDQAMKMQEKKKRDQAKAEEERKKSEAVRAKQAVWDD